MTLIIAECGINHNGSEETAYKLIDAAVAAKADVAKFQLFAKEYAGGKYAHLRLSHEQIIGVEAYCKHVGIKFACTAFDGESMEWLMRHTNMEFIKIPSGQVHNIELFHQSASSKLPVIVSLRENVCFPNTRFGPQVGSGHGVAGYRFLHVVAEYPTPPEHANLNRVKEYWCSGLSDHSGDIYIPLAAAALGAKIIECHITLDKDQEGPDHTSSLDPEQFKNMVRGVRAIEKAMA